MIAKLICALPKWLGGGHRRGKRIGKSATVADSIEFRCPRCKATWTRKERKA